MQVLTPKELIDALLETARVTAQDSPGPDEDFYDALAVTLRRLADEIERSTKERS